MYQEQGAFCIGANDPQATTIGQVVAGVRAAFVNKKPALPDLVVAPLPQTLVNVPTSFSAGSGAEVDLSENVLGIDVVIHATPARWIWSFGDGATLTTTTPGLPGTDRVTHTYRSPATAPVSVVVEWTGTFWVGGYPDEFPINGVARVDSAPVLLDVRQARTQLVDG